MNFPWETIIPIVIELIADCFAQGADEGAIRQAFRNPSRAQQVIVQWVVMREIPPRDRRGRRREIMDEVWQRAASASDSEVSLIIHQAQRSEL